MAKLSGVLWLVTYAAIQSQPVNAQTNTGLWIQWTAWSPCEVTCGGGVKWRTRICSRSNGCPGSSRESVSCGMSPYDSTEPSASTYSFVEWSSWSTCAIIERVPQKTRTRRCVDVATNIDAPNFTACDDPLGLGPRQIEQCVIVPTVSEWGQWTAFSQCSATCGDGSSFRMRSCSGQNDCVDQENLGYYQIQSCNLGPCAAWSQWTEYSQCSASCGAGQSVRRRTCPVTGRCVDPRNVGSFQAQTCNLGPCIVPLSWTPCSKTCGGGQRSRQNCFGTSCTSVFQDCNTQRCIQTGREEVEYVSRAFFRSITASASASSQVSYGPMVISSPTQECPGDFESSDKSVRMIGSPCGYRRAKRQAQPPQIATPKSKRDVVFVIDESASIGAENFRKFLTLAQTVVKKSFCGDIDIGPDKTRVGLVTFDSRQHLQMDLKASFVKASVLNGIENVSFNVTTSGFTCIGDTFDYVLRRVLPNTHGGRANDDNTEQVVILFSDGCSYCMSQNGSVSDIRQVAEELKRNEVVVLVYLVGYHSKECIEEMKQLFYESRCYQLFQFADWDKVDVTIEGIEAQQCTNKWTMWDC